MITLLKSAISASLHDNGDAHRAAADKETKNPALLPQPRTPATNNPDHRYQLELCAIRKPNPRGHAGHDVDDDHLLACGRTPHDGLDVHQDTVGACGPLA